MKTKYVVPRWLFITAFAANLLAGVMFLVNRQWSSALTNISFAILIGALGVRSARQGRIGKN